ncbi:MAG TPA: hypothetical protein VF175_14115 [Lacipirellula sp.]
MRAKAQFIRFRLWHTFIAFFVIAVALCAIPAAAEWYEWRHVDAWLRQSIAKFIAEPNKPYIHELDDGARQYAISNYEAEWDPGSITIHNTDIRRNEYFIMPPGRWAATSDEALTLFKKHFRQSD